MYPQHLASDNVLRNTGYFFRFSFEAFLQHLTSRSRNFPLLYNKCWHCLPLNMPYNKLERQKPFRSFGIITNVYQEKYQVFLFRLHRHNPDNLISQLHIKAGLMGTGRKLAILPGKSSYKSTLARDVSPPPLSSSAPAYIVKPPVSLLRPLKP